MPHLVFIIFVFILGACVGSFLNVVVWRLPRGQSLVRPGSHCPKCDHPLAWYDNIPVLGWIMLAGKCRYCRAPISPRYPIVEAICGLLFVFYYVMFFIMHIGPCAPEALPPKFSVLGLGGPRPHLPSDLPADWPIYGLYMVLIAGLLAATLIDAELFIIPQKIPYTVALIGFIGHALWDTPEHPGALNLLDHGHASPAGSLAAGGAVGLAISLLLLRWGKLPASFPEGEPCLEIDRDAYEAEVKEAAKKGEAPPPPLPTYAHVYEEAVEVARQEGKPPPPMPLTYAKPDIRREMGKEILFLLPPVLVAIAWWAATEMIRPVREFWQPAASSYWLSGLLGAIFGALIGGLIVWMVRILGTMAFGRVAMGLGDADLMFGVGAIIGAGGTAVAFFLAPFAGLMVGIYGWLTRRRHELPMGPYLSLATAVVMLCYCPIADYLRPGIEGLALVLRQLVGKGS